MVCFTSIANYITIEYVCFIYKIRVRDRNKQSESGERERQCLLIIIDTFRLRSLVGDGTPTKSSKIED